MPKSWFNEPEQYLLKRWADAQKLEATMKATRKRYVELFEKVLEEVQDNHPDLDCEGVQLKNDGYCNIALGRSAWPSKWPTWPSGIWIGRVRLEDLVAEDGDPPGGMIWLAPPDKFGLDTKEAARRFREAGPTFLTKEELDQITLEEPEEYYAGVFHSFPQSRHELLEMLLKDDAKEFVECMVGHFETLAKFIPVINDIFQGGKRKRK